VQGLALMALSVGVALVSQAPTDPYFAQNLQAWEQGRFVRFHGLAQWVGWLWPFAAIGWLLTRLRRDRRATEGSGLPRIAHELLQAPHLLLPERAQERRGQLRPA
jgi:hypothetical protein